MKYLGETFDIHCGGIDHIPIHHTNEIAEAEAATGKKFVNYWLHGAFLVLGKGVKMAKSAGNFITLRVLIEEGFDPLSFRYFCLGAHYRSELKFTKESLEFAQNSLNTLRENIRLMREDLSGPERKNEKYMNEFLSAINDDLDMPRALAVLWKVVRDKGLSNMEKYELIKEFDKVFGLDLLKEEEKEELPEEVKNLIIKREALRKTGNFKAADEIREKILREFGIMIEDTKDGVRWKKVRTT
jgi:cysteinyl-tRNA synthetase